MTSARSNARLEEWLRHEGFLRKTLRGLLASEADVDDALQQTWTKLLERPVAAPDEPRGWLVRVARNMALGGLRARRRRAEHEADAPSHGGGDSPVESAARVEALQRVGGAILALEEPYRSVVLLRHEQELDVATIARRLGRGEATVRSQLSRAHELLRQELDREFGGRERWAVLAAPLASPSVAWLVPGAAAAALVVAATAWLAWPRARSAELESAVARAAAVVPSSSAATPALDEPEAGQESRREPTSASALPAASAPAARIPFEILLQGRLGDVGGNEHHVSVDGELDYFRELAAEPLSLAPPFERRDELAYVARTALPDDHVLHVYRVDYVGHFEGMTRARRRYAIVLGGTEFLLAPFAHEDFAGTWEGDLVLDADEARQSYLSLGSSSAGEVRLWGESEPRREWERRSRAEGVARVTSAVPLPLRYPLLSVPRALLQVRAGHHGGNPIQIGLAGSTNGRVDRVERLPLDFTQPPADHDPALAHFEGGHVPTGMAFVVTRATWWSTTFQHGSVRPLCLVVAGQVLAELAPARDPASEGVDGAPGRASKNGEQGGDGERGKDGAPGEPGGAAPDDPWVGEPSTPVGEPVSGSWSGRLVVLPGEEERTCLAASYFTNGEARLFGELVPLDAVPLAERAPQRPASPPVAKRPEAPPPPELTRPRVVLQARAGHSGGNPVSLALHGKTSLYVNRIETLPLDFTQPPTSHDPALVYGEVGRIPAGQVLVVTRATWWSATYGESSHSRFKLTVAGEVLAEREGKGEPENGAWSGRLVIRPGEEERTSLEVSYFASADVLLLGYFEPLK